MKSLPESRTSRAIKSAKSKMRALRQQGLSPAKASRIVAKSDAGSRGGKSKGGRSKRDHDGGLFSGDGGTGQRRGGGREGGSGARASGSGSAKAYLRDRSGLSKSELNRVKRGGVGKSSFKSKARFKRR
jgi:ATP-dependent RNA helicase DDX27